MDIESLQGLEKQLDKLMEEKSTKAGVYSVPPVAQGVTELHVEPGRIYWDVIYQIFICMWGIDYCRLLTGDNRPAVWPTKAALRRIICLKCLGAAEPKGPGLEMATLSDYELSSNWEVSLSDAGGQLNS